MIISCRLMSNCCIPPFFALSSASWLSGCSPIRYYWNSDDGCPSYSSHPPLYPVNGSSARLLPGFSYLRSLGNSTD
ncbi:unnamed protein product [Protopolystoma xenopodis]|uniref:Uncharacterized protein n=1 Tax=Protopolystoma xenopodis TaxID=117903 RepID=A0A448XLF6_9PLAT|nr:unnamed protein product [Protopolystoma xenopodis]